jgi:Transcriptional accessory protein
MMLRCSSTVTFTISHRRLVSTAENLQKAVENCQNEVKIQPKTATPILTTRIVSYLWTSYQIPRLLPFSKYIVYRQTHGPMAETLYLGFRDLPVG